jgi:hypothetical protein
MEKPRPVNVKRDFANYQAAYTVKDGMLTSDRTLTVKQREVSLAQYDDYKAFKKYVEDDRDQLIQLHTGS